MRRRLPFLLAALALLLATTGCWDVEEINRRTVAIAMGVDLEQAGGIRVSLQLPILQGTATAMGMQSPTEKPFRVISAAADTPFAAVPELQSKTGQGLFYGQLRVVIIDAALARRGLKGVVDFLDRHPEIAPDARIILSHERARDILDFTLASKVMSGTAVLNNLTSPSKGDRAFGMKEWQFIRAAGQDRSSAYLPILALDDAEQAIDIHGMGVFNRDKMVGELSADEARMFGLLTGRTRNGYLTVNLEHGAKATFRDVHANSKIKATSPSRLGFAVEVRVKGLMVELTSAKTRLKETDVRSIETTVQNYLAGGLTDLVKRLQTLRSDIVGFGELVRARQPQLWRRINWREIYPGIPIDIRVDFNAERLGTYR